MKQLKILIAFLLLASIIKAQGIKFEQNLSWKQVAEKARRENKFIFLDIFATWCVPCKMMEKHVYSNDSVGSYFSNRFISLKVQMDQTKLDNDFIKSWYATADSIKTAYEITAYPTLIFLSPEGKMILKSVGYSSANEFYDLAKKAADPKENYIGLLGQFNSKKLPLSKYASLAVMAQKIGDAENANKVAKAYKSLYLDTLGMNQIESKENLDFIVKFYNIIDSKDKFFKIFYEQPTRADSILGLKAISQSIVNVVITKEEVFKYTGESENNRLGINNPAMANEPNWKEMTKAIASKYNGQVAENVVVASKIRWYEYKKDWPNFVKSAVEQLETKKPDTSEMGRIIINNMAYSVIFKYSTDAKTLDKGIAWMKGLLNHDPTKYTWIDTYANLLYKRGRKNEAIEYQKKAVELAKGKDESDYQELNLNLTKMISGKPTWTED